MDVNLITSIPVEAEGTLEEVEVNHPHAPVPIGVRFSDLHGLRVNSAIGEKLHLFRQVSSMSLAPGQQLLGLRNDFLVRMGGSDGLAIGNVVVAERSGSLAENAILPHPPAVWRASRQAHIQE